MRYMATTGSRVAWIALAVLGGCNVVSPEHLNELRGRDGGQDETDGGGFPPLDETCLGPGVTPRMLVRDTTTRIMVDTTSYSNDNSSACGADTRGNDAFVAIDVQAGSIWHFHLTAITPDRQPMLYFAKAGSCDARECEYVSTACTGPGDEHFAFEASESGTWYVGIDDSATGGGVYRLDAYNPSCGDGVEMHGEACDDGNMEGGDGCDRKCRVELSTLRTGEDEPNDNRVEANAILFPPSNELEITGTIGGPAACTYSDVFATTVPDMGNVEVTVLADSSHCPSPFSLVLEDSRGAVVVENRVDENGCPMIETPDLPGGEYFVRVRITEELENAAPYRLRFRLLP